jgi:antitoxin MazE
MYHVRTTIRRLGNSQGITIPRNVLDEAGFAVDSAVDMVVDGSAIVIRKISGHPRDGWAQAAELIAADVPDHEWLEADLNGESRPGHTW